MVAASPRSLAATMSNPASRSSAARKKFRPMRPKPLIATRVFAMPRTLTKPRGARPRRPTGRAGNGQAVDLAELAAEVPHVGLGVDRRRACHPLERLRRRELPAVAMEAVAQPLAQRPEVALLEPFVDVRQIGEHALPD